MASTVSPSSFACTLGTLNFDMPVNIRRSRSESVAWEEETGLV